MKPIIDRVRKLFALANDKGASLNETSVALEKAAKLMLEHGITDSDLETNGPGDYVFSMCFDGNEPHAAILARAAAKLYGVVPVFDRTTMQFVFGGPVDFVQAAEATFDEIRKKTEQLFIELMPSNLQDHERSIYQMRFLQACSIRILKKATEIVDSLKIDNGQPTKNALVVVYDKIEKQSQDFVTGQAQAKPEVKDLVVEEGPGSAHGWRAGSFVDLNKKLS